MNQTNGRIAAVEKLHAEIQSETYHRDGEAIAGKMLDIERCEKHRCAFPAFRGCPICAEEPEQSGVEEPQADTPPRSTLILVAVVIAIMLILAGWGFGYFGQGLGR